MRGPEAELHRAALAYPEAHEDFPWGETVVKVRGKVFVFLGVAQEGEWGFSLKLPHSQAGALEEPFCEPTGYGLGKAGWVTARFSRGEDVSMDTVRAWLDESYRAVAPKKLVALLDASPDPVAAATTKPARTKR